MQPVLPVKSSVENAIHPWTSPIQRCAKAGRVSVMSTSKLNTWLFSLFFTNHVFLNFSPDVIWICMGFSTSHQHCIMHVWPDQSCSRVLKLDLSDHTWHIPAMPNAEEEKRRKCRQKSWSECARFPISLAQFSLSHYTAECPTHPFPSTFSRFPISLASFPLQLYPTSHPFRNT